jgi:aminoglycoside phosphotransferase (APT) family kinase protein
MSTSAEFYDALLAVIRARVADGTSLSNLQRLSAGATMETWSFDVIEQGRTVPLILRRRPQGNAQADDFTRLSVEAAVIKAAFAAGVAAPLVRYVLQPADGLGGGFLMERIEGETIPRKIQRVLVNASARQALLQQIAATAAQIHRVPLSDLPALKRLSVEQALDEQQQEYRRQGQARPVFALALRYLEDRKPNAGLTLRLVHGDYRMGNLIVGPDGLKAVLDWDLCYIGDPLLDLAWFCVPPWRFGRIDLPAGGIGLRSQLIEAYEAAAGERVDRERVRYWEIFGSLRWGLMCSGMLEWFRSGRDRGVERAMIARRASESELDLLRALTEANDAG